MKKTPIKNYEKAREKAPITAQMAVESLSREKNWLQNGCNAFEANRKISNPMSFWTEQDVLSYIYNENLKIASGYGDILSQDIDGQQKLMGCGKLCTTGCHRTGW